MTASIFTAVQPRALALAEVPSAQDWTVAMGGDMRGAMKPIGADKRFSGDSRFDRRFGHSSKGGERGGRAGDYEGVARRGGSGDCDAGRVASAIGGAGGKRDSELTDSEVTSANISEHLDLLPDVEESTMVCTRGVGATVSSIRFAAKRGRAVDLIQISPPLK